MWKVMIVDDEKLICKLVQALVEWDKLGMQMAAQAENAIQALDMLQQYRPDILITDIRMPGMDGLELIKNAKKICPELEIIIINDGSTDGSLDIVEKIRNFIGYQAGFSDRDLLQEIQKFMTVHLDPQGIILYMDVLGNQPAARNVYKQGGQMW